MQEDKDVVRLLYVMLRASSWWNNWISNFKCFQNTTLKPHFAVYSHISSLFSLWTSCLANLKWKKMFSYYLIQSGRGGQGLSLARIRALADRVGFVPLCPPLSHTLIRAFLSRIENSPQWHSIRAGRVKTWLFLYIPSRTRRGPASRN